MSREAGEQSTGIDGERVEGLLEPLRDQTGLRERGGDNRGGAARICRKQVAGDIDILCRTGAQVCKSSENQGAIPEFFCGILGLLPGQLALQPARADGANLTVLSREGEECHAPAGRTKHVPGGSRRG